MNRLQKIALLTKVIQGDAPETRLQHYAETAPRSLIFIDNFGSDPHHPISDTDPVTFSDRGKEHRMTLVESGQYARQHRIRILVVDPVEMP